MNEMSPCRWTCCLEDQNARSHHAEWRPKDLLMACCQTTADTKSIEKFMTKRNRTPLAILARDKIINSLRSRQNFRSPPENNNN